MGSFVERCEIRKEKMIDINLKSDIRWIEQSTMSTMTLSTTSMCVL